MSERRVRRRDFSKALSLLPLMVSGIRCSSPRGAAPDGGNGNAESGAGLDCGDAGYYCGPLKMACNAFCFNAAMIADLSAGGGTTGPGTMDLMRLLDWAVNVPDPNGGPPLRFDTI